MHAQPRIPIDPNRKPFLAALSALDDSVGVALTADASTGALLTLPMGSLITQNYDYISAAYPLDTTEVYTFKTGGAGGTTVATVTVVYTDNTKANLSTVTRA